MTNFFKVTNSDGKQIIVITDYDIKQIQEYYAKKQITVQIESCIPSKEEVLQAIAID